MRPRDIRSARSTKCLLSPATGGKPQPIKPAAQSSVTVTPSSRDVHEEIGRIDVDTPTRREMHPHTNKHTHRPYDGGSSEWEKSVFLIQPQQGIKSTLCLCVMQGFAGLDRSLDTNVGRVPPLSHRCHVYTLQVLNMILVLLIWSTVSHERSLTFFYMKTEKALGMVMAWFPDFYACDPTCDHSSQVAYIYR